MILFEDSAALIGLIIALAGTYFSTYLALPTVDGVASILISVVLAVTAGLLARETKALLIGEGADPAIVDSIMRIAKGMEGVALADLVTGLLDLTLAENQEILETVELVARRHRVIALLGARAAWPLHGLIWPKDGSASIA